MSRHQYHEVEEPLTVIETIIMSIVMVIVGIFLMIAVTAILSIDGFVLVKKRVNQLFRSAHK